MARRLRATIWKLREEEEEAEQDWVMVQGKKASWQWQISCSRRLLTKDDVGWILSIGEVFRQ